MESSHRRDGLWDRRWSSVEVTTEQVEVEVGVRRRCGSKTG